MENYRWTAYMKLKGQPRARKEEEILDEFESFVESLRGADVDYSIIVMVEARIPRQIWSEYGVGETDTRVTREGSSA
jgi:hypothetical protein